MDCRFEKKSIVKVFFVLVFFNSQPHDGKGIEQKKEKMTTTTQTTSDFDRKEFILRRMQGIGGSDVAALVGLSPWTTPRDVWYSKVGHDGEGNPVDVFNLVTETDAMYWGRVLEDVVANEYALRTGCHVQATDYQFKGDPKKHPLAKNYFIANVDRLVGKKFNDIKPEDSPFLINEETGQLFTDKLLECKTSSAYMKDNWGEDGSSDIPEYYMAQVQWYMGVTGCKSADLAVLIGSNDFRIYHLERNETVIEYLFTEADKFWTEYVLADVLPPPVNVDDSVSAFPRGEKRKKVFADELLEDACRQFNELRAQVESLEKQMDDLKMQICESMQDGTDLYGDDGRKLCTWSASSLSKKIDYKKIVEHLQPTEDVLDLFTTEYQTSRRFSVAKPKA